MFIRIKLWARGALRAAGMPALFVLLLFVSVRPTNSQTSDINISRTPQTILKGHTNVISSVGFSHNGKLLVTVSEDNTTSIWDTATWMKLFTLPVGGFHAAAFSIDDRIIATSNGMLWDASTGKALDPPRLGEGFLSSAVAFSPDRKTLAAGKWDEDHKSLAAGRRGFTVTFYSTKTWKPMRSINVPGDRQFLAFSPDGAMMAVGVRDSVSLVDVTTGRITHVLHGAMDVVSSGAFSPDGNLFATGGCSNFTAQLWDTHTGKLRCSLRKHGDWVTGVSFSPDGDTLATSSMDQTVKLWNVRSGKLLWTYIDDIERIYTLAFSPDGAKLATGDGYAKTMIWEVPTTNINSAGGK